MIGKFVRLLKNVSLQPHERPYANRRGIVRQRWVFHNKSDELQVEFDTQHTLWIDEDKLREVE